MSEETTAQPLTVEELREITELQRRADYAAQALRAAVVE